MGSAGTRKKTWGRARTAGIAVAVVARRRRSEAAAAAARRRRKVPARRVARRRPKMWTVHVAARTIGTPRTRRTQNQRTHRLMPWSKVELTLCIDFMLL